MVWKSPTAVGANVIVKRFAAPTGRPTSAGAASRRNAGSPDSRISWIMNARSGSRLVTARMSSAVIGIPTPVKPTSIGRVAPPWGPNATLRITPLPSSVTIFPWFRLSLLVSVRWPVGAAPISVGENLTMKSCEAPPAMSAVLSPTSCQTGSPLTIAAEIVSTASPLLWTVTARTGAVVPGLRGVGGNVGAAWIARWRSVPRPWIVIVCIAGPLRTPVSVAARMILSGMSVGPRSTVGL